MVIAREEIFGPVLSVLRFDDDDVDGLIHRCNDTQYGLGAGVQTKCMKTALKMTNALRCGTVYVNCYDGASLRAPAAAAAWPRLMHCTHSV